MKRLAMLACAFGLLVGCNGEGTGPDDDNGNGNGDTVSADLDLATIDNTDLPFAIDVTGPLRTEILEGALTLRSDGTWERSQEVRTIDTSSGATVSSSSRDDGMYTLNGETLTLTSDNPEANPRTISGTFSNGEATLQISGRAWLYR